MKGRQTLSPRLGYRFIHTGTEQISLIMYEKETHPFHLEDHIVEPHYLGTLQH